MLLTHPPFEPAPKLSTLPMMVAYEVDMAVSSSPHVISAGALGADRVLVDARAAAREAS